MYYLESLEPDLGVDLDTDAYRRVPQERVPLRAATTTHNGMGLQLIGLRRRVSAG